MKLERLGPYRILQQIGKGGMGAVYLAAYDGPGEAAGTRVAVKALSPQLALAEGFRERFDAEIDSLKKLRHEGIVRLFGYGEQDGILFYSMELVEGTSLEEEINSGRRFSWHETLQIGIQVCKALKHAHDHGVVHRDIKPANLLLTRDRHIKIADFGIARLFGGTQLTTAGGVLGTADYMSPEQADGRPVTDKCDQYSLGGVMYALLAGRPPFRAKTMPEMLQMQRFADPEPVRRYAPATPVQVENLLSQLLSKNPDNRFPNVLVLARHMEAMDKALSRNGERSASAPQNSPKTIVDNTEGTLIAEEKMRLPHEGTSGTDSELFNAPTLAQLDEDAALETRPSRIANPVNTARFTTVDEEAQRIARQRDAEHWASLIAKWLALVLLLGGFAWAGWHFTRPLSVDDLYLRISSYIEDTGTEDLRLIGDDINDFLTRFPEDPRTDEVLGLREQLELQKLERRAMAHSRFKRPSQLSPVEQLYLEARTIGEVNPAEAQRVYRDMLALFDPQEATVSQVPPENTSASDDAMEQFRWLALARQQLARIQREVDRSALKKLPILEERMKVAQKLGESDPAAAAKMYEAIIRFYEDEPWAEDLVKNAKTRLKSIQTESAK